MLHTHVNAQERLRKHSARKMVFGPVGKAANWRPSPYSGSVPIGIMLKFGPHLTPATLQASMGCKINSVNKRHIHICSKEVCDPKSFTYFLSGGGGRGVG